MYIIKNALRCIGRAKGRNILIGVIVLVIAVSACIGLSIRQAAENAKDDILSVMNVTATISFDRASMMKNMTGESSGFDRSQFSEKMGQSSSLTLEEYKTYAEASSVKDFYYTLTASLDGSDTLLPVSSSTTEDTAGTETPPTQEGGGGGKASFNRVMGAQSDFSIIGVSKEAAMTSFIDGTAYIAEGSVFDENTESFDCIISQELAAYNGLSVGDTVAVTNPNAESESYTLHVVGIYSDSSANESSFSMMGTTSSDPANRIYMSAAALEALISQSSEIAETETDENTGKSFSTAIIGSLSGTYVFADAADYYSFEEEARAMGLGESYTVTSADLNEFENSLIPLNTLSEMAGGFLLVILLIGAVILIVLNIFNVRERKYEIGVLTAMGMKKGKVALQFLTEIFAVTLASVIIGIGIGAVSSVPVTNALLENQIESQTTAQVQLEQNMGRGGMVNKGYAPENVDYVSQIGSAMNFTVVLQMFAIAILLTLAAGAFSMLFVMRYEPLKILANRD